MDNCLYVNYCGMGSPTTENWRLMPDIEIQRFYYILGGTGWYRSADGQQHLFQKGCVYLFPYNLKHSFYTDMLDPVNHLFYDFLSMPPVIASEPLCVLVEPGSQLHNALMLTCQIQRSYPRETLTQMPMGRHLLQLLLDLVDEQTPIPLNQDPVICQTLKVLQDDYNKPITVRELARQAGFEENYFIRRFKKVMRQTPYAYLKNYRLIQARNLLIEGVPVEKVALQVGYESAASLTRALRRANV